MSTSGLCLAQLPQHSHTVRGTKFHGTQFKVKIKIKITYDNLNDRLVSVSLHRAYLQTSNQTCHVVPLPCQVGVLDKLEAWLPSHMAAASSSQFALDLYHCVQMLPDIEVGSGAGRGGGGGGEGNVPVWSVRGPILYVNIHVYIYQNWSATLYTYTYYLFPNTFILPLYRQSRNEYGKRYFLLI